MTIKIPSLLFHPKVTMAALIAAITAIAAQLTIVLNAKPLFEATFGITSSQVILEIIGKLDAGCALLVIFLTAIAAFGRSIDSAVDNNQQAKTTVTVSSPVDTPAKVEVSNAPIPTVPVVEAPPAPVQEAVVPPAPVVPTHIYPS